MILLTEIIEFRNDFDMIFSIFNAPLFSFTYDKKNEGYFRYDKR